MSGCGFPRSSAPPPETTSHSGPAGLDWRKRYREDAMARLMAAAMIVGLALAGGAPARAETTVIRGGMQWGFSYLQLILMQDQQLIEKHAKAEGMGDVKVEWITL